MAGQQKDIKIERCKDGVNYYLMYEGGGELPKELSGLYTKQSIAQQAIDSYRANRKRGRGTAKS